MGNSCDVIYKTVYEKSTYGCRKIFEYSKNCNMNDYQFDGEYINCIERDFTLAYGIILAIFLMAMIVTLCSVYICKKKNMQKIYIFIVR